MIRFRRSVSFCALAALTVPAMASAQEPRAREVSGTCVAPLAPTGELAAWASPVPLAAAGSAEHVGHAALPVGQAATVALRQTPDVRYPLRPEKPGGSVSYGGLIDVQVVEAGTYRVALGSGAWIDLVRDGKAVGSIGHGHGPECSGIRKMVDFPLESGRYMLQIAANGAPQVSVLVVRIR